MSALIMALLLEVLQKSKKTYAIDRGFYGFCQNMNNRMFNSILNTNETTIL